MHVKSNMWNAPEPPPDSQVLRLVVPVGVPEELLDACEDIHLLLAF